MEKIVSYRHNIMNVNSIDTFLSVKGGYNNGLRDVYFVRGVGEPANIESVIRDIDRRMEMEMRNGRLCYFRISILPQLNSSHDIQFYTESYNKWRKDDFLRLRNNDNEILTEVLNNATNMVLDIFRKNRHECTESIEKNFVVKLWYWTDFVLEKIAHMWTERCCIKILADNIVKEQEYLFYYMLTLIGCDIMLIENKRDIACSELLKKLSVRIELGQYGITALPEYTVCVESSIYKEVSHQEEKTSEQMGDTHQAVSYRTIIKRDTTVKPANVRDAWEKSFEELALMASSIVMITVHDHTGEPVASGSGIMIGEAGFILTNNHVIRGGYSFTVRIEDDETIYATDEVIKYNSVLDLAVIRIDKRLTPLSIYKGGKKLVRGQKVVAIGSPLGLFNSVSDGIISGFRNINDVDMIQFTAPTSHGSSGGAILNMQGEVIGISTAGIDSGQNINLAVGYESICIFAKGFY